MPAVANCSRVRTMINLPLARFSMPRTHMQLESKSRNYRTHAFATTSISRILIWSVKIKYRTWIIIIQWMHASEKEREKTTDPNKNVNGHTNTHGSTEHTLYSFTSVRLHVSIVFVVGRGVHTNTWIELYVRCANAHWSMISLRVRFSLSRRFDRSLAHIFFFFYGRHLDVRIKRREELKKKTPSTHTIAGTRARIDFEYLSSLFIFVSSCTLFRLVLHFFSFLHNFMLCFVNKFFFSSSPSSSSSSSVFTRGTAAFFNFISVVFREWKSLTVCCVLCVVVIQVYSGVEESTSIV